MRRCQRNLQREIDILLLTDDLAAGETTTWARVVHYISFYVTVATAGFTLPQMNHLHQDHIL